MKKLINQPFLHTCVLILALLMAQGACGQNLVFMHQADSGGPDGTEVTAKSVNWTGRSNISWPKAFAQTPVASSPIYVSDVKYSSSDVSVATVNETSGDVTVLAYSGTVTISATYTGVDASYADASYVLTIVDDRRTIADNGVAFSASTASATYGDATVSTPTLEGGQLKLTSADMTWSSSVTGVATVNTSGDVTIVGAGETVISASFAGNVDVKPGSVSYTLTVAQKVVGLTWGETNFTYDGSAHVPTATATGLVGSDACTVTVDGAKTNAGSYTATASALSNANYKLPNANTTAFTIAKADATVKFSTATASAKMGTAFTAPTATTTPAGLALSYASSDTKVATVNASTGAVTLVAAGTTTITASFAGNDNYNAASASYKLTVSKADAPADERVEPELSFSADRVSVDYGKSFDPPTLNNPQNLPVTWGSTDATVATVAADGTVTIVKPGSTDIYASFVGNDNYLPKEVRYSLTVALAASWIGFDPTEISVAMNESFTEPRMVVVPSDLPVTFTSSNKNVATVDEVTGKVTLVADGTTVITATFEGNEYYKPTSGSYTLKVGKSRLLPITKEEDYEMEADDFVNPDGTEVDLTNTVINNILFTLKNQNSEEGDGWDPDLESIVLNTVQQTAGLNALISNGVEPCSEEYAAGFTGITFLVPAGEGFIIVTSQEAEGVYLMTKVGDHEPVAINMLEMGDYSIPYQSDTETWVYLYNGGRNSGGTRGKKGAADVRIRNTSYKSHSRGAVANGISQVSCELSDDDNWYDVNGQRISRPVKKGVYIHGHRKVVIR